jgi:hypothetical protein
MTENLRASSMAAKGVVLGALGGIVGLLAMDVYWTAVVKTSGFDPRSQRAQGALDSISLIGDQHREGETATAALGRILYHRVTGHDPGSKDVQTLLSNAVHWTVSMGLGGLYGAVRARASSIDLNGGLIFGSAVWLLGDELFNPLVGLADGPTAYSAAVHAHALVAHLAYGAATSTVTQLLGRLVSKAKRVATRDGRPGY